MAAKHFLAILTRTDRNTTTKKRNVTVIFTSLASHGLAEAELDSGLRTVVDDYVIIIAHFKALCQI